MTGLRLVAAAHAVPKNIMTNFDFEKIIDTSDEWITTRTGINKRHFAKGETNAQLASEAAKKAIEKANISVEDIALCIVATFTPDTLMPNMSSTVAQNLNLKEETLCFDINAACTGFIYALNNAAAIMAEQKGKYALIIGSEVLSKYMDMQDRGTCVLFGDGAGAAVFAPDTEHEFYFSSGCRPDMSALTCTAQGGTIKMDGPAVFRFATEIVPKCVKDLLEKANLTIDDIDCIVCHQANKRIIEAASRRLGADISKFFINLQSYGNTSAASIPIALSELSPKKGSRIICVGFGGGLSYGAALLYV